MVENIKRLRQGVDGVEQRVPHLIGEDEFSDEDDEGRRALQRR